MPKRIELRERINSDCDVLADPTQVHQVILNLGANARDAIGERAGVIEVALTEREIAGMQATMLGLKPGRYAEISFRDNGLGISPEIKTRIFEPFFTTKPIGKGSGLGLSVVHGIITQHDGAIEVESVEGEGACFTILLPLLPATASAAQEPATSHEAAD